MCTAQISLKDLQASRGCYREDLPVTVTQFRIVYNPEDLCQSFRTMDRLILVYCSVLCVIVFYSEFVSSVQPQVSTFIIDIPLILLHIRDICISDPVYFHFFKVHFYSTIVSLIPNRTSKMIRIKNPTSGLVLDRAEESVIRMEKTFAPQYT